MMKPVVLLACACFGLYGSAPASAQSYPSKPIRMIVPFAAGAPDAAARILAQQLQVQMGQPVLVENRPGANGLPGTEAVARADPDGYTLLMVSTSIAINPSLYRKMPFDVQKDLEPVTAVVTGPGYILVVNPALPVKTVKELVALAKTPGRQLTYGTPGFGNALHLATEMFTTRAGISVTHAPYKGAGPAIADLIGGHIQMMFVTPPLSMPHIRSGKLRPIGFAGPKRWSELPEVPVMAEAGIEGVVLDGGWYGLFAPARTPAVIVNRLYSEVQKALGVADVRERYAKMMLDPVGNTPAEFRVELADQIRKYAELVKAAKIEPQ
ncbi:MAG: tripartite tricarboxylate transporter substrate binding protein [Rhodocyclaceae bacterium]|nr:tripartite tricarboxylate transporter substrate binding protein [Rhodocyclaceae bacterium]MCA3117051.1 tripartite tricarboxylate transporter substrate binding protein [Rhodocyclaceae bacterium]MCA3137387.1 tripartite tricarboxylate transporter substrate binding protein [Rhodocyclaceae bacterium]MCA3152411.1 tripartite tricarboxylate transporter substrate binding protein [Rhodocyclaceae bacterium]MCA4903777.1 tripartite tricarboxylate transporter substrate binding protein [Rhodocyclaceae bact